MLGNRSERLRVAMRRNTKCSEPNPAIGAHMDINVECRLDYDVEQPTSFIFQIEAAKADGQVIKSESLALPPNSAGLGYEEYVDPISLTRRIRCLLGPGRLQVAYRATVSVDTAGFQPSVVREFEFQQLPMSCVDYLTPSRYCPSDTFTEFAHAQFGHLARGHTRVMAICDWIFENISYQSGSTNSATNAADVFKSKTGVCRDFAHLGITLSRALGIPARYASVYADALVPQDFHALFQAYLNGPNGGEWFSFDATRMSSVEAVVRIAAGKDAADVAFAWPQGEVEGGKPLVAVSSLGRNHTELTELAVSAG
jgi:transglutaminase-like putative cysteine protease